MHRNRIAQASPVVDHAVGGRRYDRCEAGDGLVRLIVLAVGDHDDTFRHRGGDLVEVVLQRLQDRQIDRRMSQRLKHFQALADLPVLLGIEGAQRQREFHVFGGRIVFFDA